MNGDEHKHYAEGVNGLRVRTARINYSGADRLDITRKSGRELGLMFAPSWEILTPAIEARAKAKAMRDRLERSQQASLFGEAVVAQRGALIMEQADAIERDAWAAYVSAYVEEMRMSYRSNRTWWEALLGLDRVTLCCYCADAERCHRRLLAGILAKLGATDEGEVRL